MLTPKFNITAYDNVQNKRMHLFTWCRDAERGIERAKSEAAELGLDKYLSDYQAEPIESAERHQAYNSRGQAVTITIPND